MVTNNITISSGHETITKKSYTGVDVFKFFFALCIVALHTEALAFLPYTANYMITRIVFRVAVPYFFVSSGFFLGKKLLNTTEEQYSSVIRTYCLRLLTPLVFFELISLAYYGLTYLRSGKDPVSTIIALVQSVLFYPFGALWFVQACIVGALLLYPFLKKGKLNLALIMGVVLYFFALIANNYSFIITDTPLAKIVNTYLEHCISARNGLFVGFIFIAIGILCSKIHNTVCKRKHIAKIFSLMFFLVYIAEILLVYFFNKKPSDDGSLYISYLLFIPALFITTLQFNISIPTKLSVLLRNLSTGVYFLHRPILYITASFISTGWLNFLIVSFIAIFVCLLAYKTRFKILHSLLK